MLPHEHVIISASVGALGWLLTGDPVAGAAALAAGILPDVDHVADYTYYHQYGIHRLILPFHGYEYAVLGAGIALLAGNQVIGMAALSYFIHLLADQKVNHTHKLGYSLLFRAWHRFRIEDISMVPEEAKQGRVENMQQIKKLFLR
jgi:hypothetical protein